MSKELSILEGQKYYEVHCHSVWLSFVLRFVDENAARNCMERLALSKSIDGVYLYHEGKCLFVRDGNS